MFTLLQNNQSMYCKQLSKPQPNSKSHHHVGSKPALHGASSSSHSSSFQTASKPPSVLSRPSVSMMYCSPAPRNIGGNKKMMIVSPPMSAEKSSHQSIVFTTTPKAKNPCSRNPASLPFNPYTKRKCFLSMNPPVCPAGSSNWELGLEPWQQSWYFQKK